MTLREFAENLKMTPDQILDLASIETMEYSNDVKEKIKRRGYNPTFKQYYIAENVMTVTFKIWKSFPAEYYTKKDE